MPDPTVDDVLARCEHRGWAEPGLHGVRHMREKLLVWRADGREITVPASTLRAALERVYNPVMSCWPDLVDL